MHLIKNLRTVQHPSKESRKDFVSVWFQNRYMSLETKWFINIYFDWHSI